MSRSQKPYVMVIAALLGIATVTTHALPQDGAKREGAAPEHRTRNVAIVVHEGVELLDFAGPGEVFAAAARRGAPAGSKWFNVYTVAPKAGTITAQGFVKVEPQYIIDNCPKPDILVIPGGDTGQLTDDPKFMSWVRDNASQREISMSVCTGAFALADAGLLRGQDATTHWGSIDGLKNVAGIGKVHENIRFIDNGKVITTAGVSAGIDGSLHVVARLLGLAIAQQTARYMEYQWKPDDRFVSTYSKFNPQLDQRGQVLQQADALRQAQDWPAAIQAYEALTQQYPDDGQAWYLLGYCVHASGDMGRAIEIHKKAATFEATKVRAMYNLACAYAVKGDKDQAFKTLNETIDLGWNNPGYLDGDSDWKALRSDSRYAAAKEKMQSAKSDH